MFFHSKETPNLNTIFFKKKNNKLRKIPKTLIISGGSRNGNHLIWSLLDGNDDIPYLPGEDKFLSQIFWRNLRSSKIFENNLMKKKSSFLRKMSGLRSDKWIRFYKKNINKKIWAGKHKPSIMPLLEFPKSESTINYPAYRDYLDKNFNNNFSFYEIWELYLRAQNLLANKKNKKYKYKYIYAESGLRRELLYLAKNKFNFVCVVPIRKFETFYFSKIKAKFGTTNITKKFLKEAWEQWFHKTSDYIFLKKKYPKKFLLIPYEDFESSETRLKSMKKLCNFLKINFKMINLKNTHFKKKVLPNSSFAKKINLTQKIKKKSYLSYQFPKEKIPKQYFNFYKNLKNYFYK